MSQENVEIVRRADEAFQAALARGDPGGGFDSEFLAPDAEWILPPEVPGFRPVYRGRDGFIEFMRTWTEDFEEWSSRIERLIDAGGNRVVGVFHQRAIGKASSVRVEWHTGLVYELEDGRIIRMRNYIDPAEALEAAGLSE
jgi:ketosteroid isomerase-like protein